MQSEDALTDRQWLWLQCQLLLDDGIQACPQCEALGAGPYCTACGRRVQAEARTCDQCQMQGVGAFCQYCGTALESAVAEAIAQGTFDWEEWAKSLTPFLGGMTPQEEALLQHG